MKISSPAFHHEAAIPKKHTCKGADVSPELVFEGVPAGAKSLALIVDDPDAPDPKAPLRTWVHWVRYNIPATTAGLPEGAGPTAGGRNGCNDWGGPFWGGPCPPIGRHRYFFKLYALDTLVEEKSNMDKGDLLVAMEGHVLADAVLMGTYEDK